MPTYMTFIQHSIGNSSQSYRSREKSKKVSQIKKEEIKWSLIADNMVPYIENLKDATNTVKTNQQI